MGSLHIEHPENVWLYSPREQTFNDVWSTLRRIAGALKYGSLESLACSGMITPKWDGSPAYHTDRSGILWYGKKPVDPEGGSRFADRHGKQIMHLTGSLPNQSIIECLYEENTSQNVIEYVPAIPGAIAVIPNKLFHTPVVDNKWTVISGIEHWRQCVLHTENLESAGRGVYETVGALYELAIDKLNRMPYIDMDMSDMQMNTRQTRAIRGWINRVFEVSPLEHPSHKDILDRIHENELARVKSEGGRQQVDRDIRFVEYWILSARGVGVLEIAEWIRIAKNELVKALDLIQAGYQHPVVNPCNGKHEGWVWWNRFDDRQPLKLVQRDWFSRMNRESHA